MLGECLVGDETFFAYDTLIAEVAGVILHVLVQLNGRGECSFAVFASIRFLFVMD